MGRRKRRVRFVRKGVRRVRFVRKGERRVRFVRERERRVRFVPERGGACLRGEVRGLGALVEGVDGRDLPRPPARRVGTVGGCVGG
jgi:hypothetical protein